MAAPKCVGIAGAGALTPTPALYVRRGRMPGTVNCSAPHLQAAFAHSPWYLALGRAVEITQPPSAERALTMPVCFRRFLF